MNKRLPEEFCNLKFNTKITRWDEALPLGNGESGCLIWGDSNALRFSLDRGDIWDKTPAREVLSKEFTYETLVKLAKAKDVEEIRRLFDTSYNRITPTKLPAGKLIFDFGASNQILSELDLATAQATVKLICDDKATTIKSYMHATKRAGFIQVGCSMSEFALKLDNPEFGIEKNTGDEDNDALANSLNTASLKMLHYKAPTVFDDSCEKWFIQPIKDGFAYGIFLAMKEINGKTEIVYTVSTGNDGDNWNEDAKRDVARLLEQGYDACFAQHSQWWSDYWNKSSVSLPNAMFEKNWYLTNYLLASCSRKGCYPMPLQGVWTADNGELPPWKGDYHHDLNTQMSYYHYLKANHMDEGESFVDYLWSTVPQARKFAKSFFNSDGLCLPAVMAIDATALGGWPMYTLNVINQLWLCQAFERHYRFSGDIKFLEEKAYPYIKESVECLLGILEEDEDGYYLLPISSSPEIHDDNAEAWVTPNSNYDLSLMRYAAQQLVRFSKILCNGEEERWQRVLDKMPQLAVNSDNVLMLSPDESLCESHRHHAHTMSIHPIRQLTMDNEHDRKIIDATILNMELLGTGQWVGFSFTWMAELYAVQGNGNGAAYQLEVFWRNCCSQNGFHLNGDYKKRGVSQFHYRPFTLEANMCAADALQEMLLQTENQTLSFFPAIPEEWLEESIEFEDFRAESGLLVSAKIELGTITCITLKPKYDGEIYIKNADMINELKCDIDCEISKDNNLAKLILKAGNIYSFTRK